MYADTFFVLDFDRCIGNTNGIQSVLEEVLQRETGISPETFHAARTRIEGEGKTFDTIRHVHLLLDEAGSAVTWEHIRAELIKEAKKTDLLLPHARELLAILDEKELPYGIITYGVEEAWQLTKLEIADLLAVPHLVTHIEEKGRLLTGWKQTDGSFIVPPALSRDFKPRTVSRLIFLDDKAKSFWGIPEGVEGVHIIAPGGNTLPAQQGDVPESVTDVTGIDGAIKLLFSK
jgi:hypothetical protein